MEIARQMLLAHIMENTQFCALQVRIKRFCCIVVRIATNKFLLAVIHPIMTSEHFTGLAIALKLIGHQVRSLINKTCDVRQKIGELVTFNRYSPNRAVAFNRNKHSLFFGSSTSFVFDPVLISRLAADIFFIQFNDALQRRNKLRSRVHHLPDCMTDFPGTFLRNTDPFAQKDGGYALT
jgi:hypothetical protein